MAYPLIQIYTILLFFSPTFTLCFMINDDVLGLTVFKSDVGNPPELSSWNEDDNSPCSWQFIHCDSRGRVSEISLNGLGLKGKLGRGLEKLQGLKVLSLSRNNLMGQIGAELAQISTLQRLDLSHNQFSGQLPDSIANMGSLQFLDLSENLLSGSILESFFGDCVSLRYLSLSGNSLGGSLPSSLSRCSVLNALNLSSNYLSGDPFSSGGIWSFRRLRVLDLSSNRFSGPVPVGMFQLHTLKELHLQGNQFSGAIPSDIGFCPHLIQLDLSDNLFTGALPPSLERLSTLTRLSVANNMLTGDFPSWIGNLNSLEYLSLSNNKLKGNIPTTLVDCTQILVLLLKGNNFNGSIPEGLFGMGLKELDLSENQFTGSIPPGSGKMLESLLELDLSKNNLTGEIPPEMGLFSGLRYMNLSWNALHSMMPPELGYLQNLTALDLRSSDLYGRIPDEVCDSGSLEILQLDGNSLAGPIPKSIGNCSSLYLLSMSHNNLNGPIPNSMSFLKKLEIMRLEFNELSGEIPQELGDLQDLLAANISYNRLTGMLPPRGIFPSLDQSSLRGNTGLCSPLLKGPCKMNVPKPLVLNPNAYPNQMRGNRPGNELAKRLHHRKFLSISAIIAISAAAIILVGVVLVSLLNASTRRKLSFIDNALESIRSSSSSSGASLTGKLVVFDSRSSGNLVLNPESLLNKASEIGTGVFGTVYKASFGAEGRVVAIRKLIMASTHQQNQSDFDREVRTLGKVRHPNVVSLRGYHWTPQIQLLISDYAPNSSLQFQLHQRPPSTPSLSWNIRFKIMLGTAKGLAYLHHCCNPPIIHYNLKPSNVLLDENYNAKISDFGLARLLPKLDKKIVGKRFQGAPGYAAPELACQSLRIDEKCDVYGFGVMVLEMVTGKRPIEYREDNVIILNDNVRVMMKRGDALDCVDPTMGEFPEAEGLPVLELALVCTSPVPSSRPSMAEVVQILQVIRTPAPQRLDNDF